MLMDGLNDDFAYVTHLHTALQMVRCYEARNLERKMVEFALKRFVKEYEISFFLLKTGILALLIVTLLSDIEFRLPV